MSNKRNQPSNMKRREPSTLDWDAIRRRNAERLDDEISRGVDDPMTRRRLQDRERAASGLAPIIAPAERPIKRSAPRPSRAKSEGAPTRSPGFRLRPDQVADIIDKYTRHNMKPDDIADEMDITNKTVIDRLKRAGVYDPNKFRARDASHLHTPENKRKAVESNHTNKRYL